MTRAPHRREAGLSLLELLVAMAIMALSLGMLYQATGGAVRGVEDTERYQRAQMLAQSLLRSRDAVPAGGWAEQGEGYGFRWTVSSAPYATGVTSDRVPVLHRVAVQVDWVDRRGARRIALDTLMPQARPQPGASR